MIRQWVRVLADERVAVRFLPYLILAALSTWLAVLQPASASVDRLGPIANLSLVLILVGFGQTIVLLTGGIDLSVGGVLSLASVLAASHMETPQEASFTILLLLAFGWAPGLVNGLLIARTGLQPFIVTLAAWFVWGGVAFYILAAPGGTVAPEVGWLTTGRIAGMPNALTILICLVLFGLWFTRTPIGRDLVAVGSDREAAHLSGVRVTRTVLAAYGLSSWFAVAAGVILTSQSLSGNPTVGNGYILTSVAAAVIGGTSLFGGSGTLVGTAAGALVLFYLYSVAFALALPAQVAQVVTGVLLVVTVAVQLVVQTLLHRRAIGRSA